MFKNTDSRVLFGFYLLTALLILAITIGIGHVEEKTSYGLDRIVDGLKNLTMFWAGWAFQTRSNGDNKNDKSNPS